MGKAVSIAVIILTLAWAHPGAASLYVPAGLTDNQVLAQMEGGGGGAWGDRGQGPRMGRRRSIDDMQKAMAKQFEDMIKYIELDEKQEKQARSLFEDLQKSTKDIFEAQKDGKMEPMAARDSTREVAADYRDKFDQLLTDQQRTKLEEWSRKHARGGMRESSGSGQGWDGDRPRRR